MGPKISAKLHFGAKFVGGSHILVPKFNPTGEAKMQKLSKRPSWKSPLHMRLAHAHIICNIGIYMIPAWTPNSASKSTKSNNTLSKTWLFRFLPRPRHGYFRGPYGQTARKPHFLKRGFFVFYLLPCWVYYTSSLAPDMGLYRPVWANHEKNTLSKTWFFRFLPPRLPPNMILPRPLPPTWVL